MFLKAIALKTKLINSCDQGIVCIIGFFSEATVSEKFFSIGKPHNPITSAAYVVAGSLRMRYLSVIDPRTQIARTQKN